MLWRDNHNTAPGHGSEHHVWAICKAPGYPTSAARIPRLYGQIISWGPRTGCTLKKEARAAAAAAAGRPLAGRLDISTLSTTGKHFVACAVFLSVV